jgi:hypothetical protein
LKKYEEVWDKPNMKSEIRLRGRFHIYILPEKHGLHVTMIIGFSSIFGPILVPSTGSGRSSIPESLLKQNPLLAILVRQARHLAE